MSKEQKEKKHTTRKHRSGRHILARSLRYAGMTLFVLAAALFVAALAIRILTFGDRIGEEDIRTIETEYVVEKEDPVEQIPTESTDGDDRYPMPEYAFKTEEIIVPIEGLENSYRIAFVNDVHMITDHAAGDVAESNLPVVQNRYETLAVTSDGVHSEDLWPEIIKYLNYNDFDAVVFAGDILDYSSGSNYMALKNGIESLKYPKDRLMYLRSDHDYGGWYGENVYTDNAGFTVQTYVLDGDKGENCIDFGEFMILGINKSYQNLSRSRADFLNEKLDEGKPTILATHVPFYSAVDSTLKERSIQVRNRIYYWNQEDSSYEPDDRTQEFINRIYAEDSNVVQIVAAHLHASWDGPVTEKLREHIFAPSFEGQIGIIYVIPAE